MRRGLHIVLAVLLALLPAVASADILEWTDAGGVTHYTNLKEEVPAQQAVEVVVDEQVWLPQGPAVPEAKAEPAAQPEPPPNTEDEVARAYLAGLNSGLADNVSTGGDVYINGPLAVTIAPPTPYGPTLYPSYAAAGYDWLLTGYYPYVPYVTTSVIGRHRGLRGRPGFRGSLEVSRSYTGPAGPPPIGAAGPPPIGAAGPPPIGAAGRPPLGAAGGGSLRGSGGRFWR